MTSQTEMRTYPVVDSLIDIFAQWLHHRREVADACSCDGDEFSRIAQDLGVSTTDLDALIQRGPHAANELPKMIAALNLDANALRRAQPLVMRDMERVCGLCNNKRQCNSELAAGTAAQNNADFCSNSPTLGFLAKETGLAK